MCVKTPWSFQEMADIRFLLQLDGVEAIDLTTWNSTVAYRRPPRTAMRYVVQKPVASSASMATSAS